VRAPRHCEATILEGRCTVKIRDIMTPDVEYVWPDDTLQEAAVKMKDLDVGTLPVCDRARVVGILTDRDVTVRAVAEGRDPRSTRVRDIMTKDIIYCYDDEDEEAATRLMQERQVRRILILNRGRRLVGIVSLGDLAAETGDPQRIGEILQDVSEPAIPRR
jgi:CBS domain-containing protein